MPPQKLTMMNSCSWSKKTDINTFQKNYKQAQDLIFAYLNSSQEQIPTTDVTIFCSDGAFPYHRLVLASLRQTPMIWETSMLHRLLGGCLLGLPFPRSFLGLLHSDRFQRLFHRHDDIPPHSLERWVRMYSSCNADAVHGGTDFICIEFQ